MSPSRRATIRSVLRQFSLRFPQLHEALWDRQSEDLAEHIEILVNDAVLGISHTLDSEVKDGDRISLVGLSFDPLEFLAEIP